MTNPFTTATSGLDHFFLPTYDAVKTFMEHGTSDEIDLTKHITVDAYPANYDDSVDYRSTPSPPQHSDLVDLIHR